MNVIALIALFAAAVGTPYAGPKTVYILPMAGGLDQYVAQSLTKDHIMQVVTDPKAAEVIMTDRLGQSFELQMKEIHPQPAREAKKDDKDDALGLKTNDTTPHIFRSSRALGTIFLVDAKSLHVLWSEYQRPPRSNSDRDLNRTAEDIARKISGSK
jgi:hypothetical protein